MTEHDRQQLEGYAQSLREELIRMPRHRFNETKIRDREAKLARIENRLAAEATAHCAFLAHRAALAARFYAAPRMGGPR
jgi:hypothetical protein